MSSPAALHDTMTRSVCDGNMASCCHTQHGQLLDTQSCTSKRPVCAFLLLTHTAVHCVQPQKVVILLTGRYAGKKVSDALHLPLLLGPAGATPIVRMSSGKAAHL